MEFLKAGLKFLASLFLTKKFVKELIVFFLEKFVASTDNSIDDKLLKELKEKLFKAEEPKAE